jgi:hypothetical protein
MSYRKRVIQGVSCRPGLLLGLPGDPKWRAARSLKMKKFLAINTSFGQPSGKWNLAKTAEIST